MTLLRIFVAVWLAIASLAGAAAPHGEGAIRIKSRVLNEERQYYVQLPASYSWAKDRRYPVLYLLDGETQFGHTAATADFLAKQGDIPEMIVVGLNSTVRIRDFTQTDWPEAWIGGGGAGNFLRFLSSELIPDIERRYRTDGFRVLSGHSAGGQFALHALTAEPALFRACFAFSPSLDWDHNLPQRSLGKFLSTVKSVPAFLYVARSDDAGRALQDYDEVVDTLKASKPEGFRWHSQSFPEETHSSIPLLANIDALRALYKGYRFHSDMADKGLPYARQHFAAVSKLVGWELPVPESAVNELGYAALSGGKQKEAIELFELNTKNNPNSANAFDSLADGYIAAKDWPNALRAAKRAAALAQEQDNPDLNRFMGQIKKIQERATQGK
jgi:predicted alpha/beta superfamily hydrolase